MIRSAEIRVHRRTERFASDDRRVITRFLNLGSEQRMRSIIRRVLQLSDAEVSDLLERVERNFSSRHHDLKAALLQNYAEVARYVADEPISAERELLIGAYFTMEYSIESAALFNPSIVPHPDQSDMPPGNLRFLMSLRATGEGHVSSIVFRRGILHSNGHVEVHPCPRSAYTARPVPDKRYERKLFRQKLGEMGVLDAFAIAVLNKLGEYFTLRDLKTSIETLLQTSPTPPTDRVTGNAMIELAHANYDLRFPPEVPPEQMVIFPATESESRGMEDLRLVRFVNDDGSVTYYGTYTAYDGHRIMPQMLQTRDFHHFHVATINGKCAQNKGMALFPRKVKGKYVMISRLDGENLYIMRSDHPHFWNEAQLLQQPRYPWEAVQLGNSGSPIETEAGWLLLTHGVGPMRQYCIGATLLDRDDPSRILGQTPEPILVPQEDEREGYVPNVVYTCGALIHEGQLVMPYAMADRATAFATIDVQELIDYMLRRAPKGIKPVDTQPLLDAATPSSLGAADRGGSGG